MVSTAASREDGADLAEWFIGRDDGQHEGPLPLAELRRRYRSGRLADSASVWKDGLADWVHAGDLPDLENGSAETQRVGPPAVPRAAPTVVQGWKSPLALLKHGAPGPGVFRLIGRVAGVLGLAALLASAALILFGYQWLTQALLLFCLCLIGESSAAILVRLDRLCSSGAGTHVVRETPHDGGRDDAGDRETHSPLP